MYIVSIIFLDVQAEEHTLTNTLSAAKEVRGARSLRTDETASSNVAERLTTPPAEGSTPLPTGIQDNAAAPPSRSTVPEDTVMGLKTVQDIIMDESHLGLETAASDDTHSLHAYANMDEGGGGARVSQLADTTRGRLPCFGLNQQHCVWAF